MPLLYRSARVALQINGLYVGADIKSFSLELNDVNNQNTDLEYDGLFLNGYFKF